MTEQEINAAAQWLRQQAESLSYGEASIKIVVHDGRVREIQRSVLEKSRETG